MDPAVLPWNTEANRITLFVIHQKVVRPLDPLRKRASRLNYICKPRVPNRVWRGFSSAGTAATASHATQGFG